MTYRAEKPSKPPFTLAELNQLLNYCEDREREGWYYGNKEQFEKRHKRIIEKLELMFLDCQP